MLTQILQAIASFDTNDAIEALDDLYNECPLDDIKAATTSIKGDERFALISRFEARNERKCWGGFKAGDRVMIRSELVDIPIVKRGRLRTLTQRSGQLRRRIGACLTVVGTGKYRGSRKLFYKAGVLGQRDLCLYPSLIGVELVVDEVCAPYLVCRRKLSSTTTPGLLASDLVSIDA